VFRGSVVRIYQRKKAANKELVAHINTTGAGPIGLDGIGPSGAARPLVEAGDITRFPERGHSASWTGTGPVDASSGDSVRHRLPRGGNRQITIVLHMRAIVQLRNHTQGRAYYHRKLAAGKSCDRCNPARPARIPTPALRTSHFPDPPTQSLGPRPPRRHDTEASHERTSVQLWFVRDHHKFSRLYPSGMWMTWSVSVCRGRCRSRRVDSSAPLQDGEVAFGI
jgi:transposase